MSVNQGLSKYHLCFERQNSAGRFKRARAFRDFVYYLENVGILSLAMLIACTCSYIKALSVFLFIALTVTPVCFAQLHNFPVTFKTH